MNNSYQDFLENEHEIMKLELAKAKEVLQFYANPNNYTKGECISKSSFEQYEASTYAPPAVLTDWGTRARLWLIAVERPR